MNILDAIVEHKRIEILKRKKKRSLSNLATFPHYRRETNPLFPGGPGDPPGIIAEFKRRSPSKGDIHTKADAVEVALGYSRAGASAISVLTDRKFFGGSFRDLSAIREALPDMPLLRKDFIIDPYQLHEASAYGADLVLLIAAILDRQEISDLVAEAGSLDLQVLFEVHSEDELEKYVPGIGFVGVNNRDLKTFQVDTSRSHRMIGQLPREAVPVSESGLGDPDELLKLRDAGYPLFLMGESFMRAPDPGAACENLIKSFSKDV